MRCSLGRGRFRLDQSVNGCEDAPDTVAAELPAGSRKGFGGTFWRTVEYALAPASKRLVRLLAPKRAPAVYAKMGPTCGNLSIKIARSSAIVGGACAGAVTE
jgi:hypothetical protein